MLNWPESLEKLRGTLGLWTMALDALEPRAAQAAANEIESLGYSALWLPEAWGRESFTNASMLLSGTSRIVIATGIANIWGRDAFSAQNGAKTLSALFDGRFVLGLGVSHEPLVHGLRGHEYATPLRMMRNYLTAMDAAPMFAQEGATRVARIVAALGPRMIELASELTDGAHPYLVTPDYVATTRSLLGDKFLGVEQAVVLGQSREEFLRRAHEHLNVYTGLENYRNSWRRQGFEESDFVRGGSERLCDALVVHGDETTVLNKINEHRAAGADHVCLQVLGHDITSAPTQEWRDLAAIVAS